MLAEAGHPTADYDPNFRPDDALLKPGGFLSVMTERLTPERDFAGWRYRRQPSHVVFYSDQTIDWMARRFGWRSSLHGPLVVLFEKAA